MLIYINEIDKHMMDVTNFIRIHRMFTDCSLCNLTKTQVMVSKEEHKRKPKYVDDSCGKLSTVTQRADSAQFGRHIRVYDSARSLQW